ncbi:HAD family phosphatase [candidate division WWE3 bacterium]|uniref:HAD family phosphatase n=1 Tax=candidate division WWE3 bacterium TaxID=2053526 RepID=A0A955LVB1_UNCKA|nr:HAD family phosphatase [candidate division WWE3 bacterium]
MIKAICFDLDGVFFTDAGFRRFKEEIMNRGVAKADVDYILHEEPMEIFKRGEIDPDQFWQNAVEYWKIQTPIHEIIHLIPQGYEINPSVKEVIDSVREAGYVTCVCSNNFVTRVEALEERFGFLEHFDAAVFSYEVGVLKPDAKIFQELITRAGVEPQELAYSDDNESKLSGAKELGINAFVYQDFDQFVQELRWLGVEV